MSDSGAGGAFGSGAAIVAAVGTATASGGTTFVISPTPIKRQVHTTDLSRVITTRRIGQAA